MAPSRKPADTRAGSSAQWRGGLRTRGFGWPLAALVLVLPSLAWPQPFERLYGNRRERFAAAVPVQHCGAGGAFAVGESWVATIGPVSTYVQRTDRQGRLLWARTLRFPEPYSGLLIRSIVEPRDGSGVVLAGGLVDPFALNQWVLVAKLDCAGKLRWAGRYAFGRGSEAFAMVEAKHGGTGVSPSDLLVAGYVGADALIMRISASGAWRWGRTYRADGQFHNFLALAEADVAPGAGDVIAVGAKDPLYGPQPFAARVSGVSGRLSSPYHCGGRYGFTGWFQAVTELKDGSLALFGKAGTQALAVHTKPAPCSALVARSFERCSGCSSSATSAVELGPGQLLGAPGDLAVAGYFGDWTARAFLLVLGRGDLAPRPAKARVYGAQLQNQYSWFRALRPEADGFLLAGGAFDASGRADAYLVKTDLAGNTGCERGEAVSSAALTPTFVAVLSEQATGANSFRMKATAERSTDSRVSCGGP